jgi:hypothetical protein
MRWEKAMVYPVGLEVADIDDDIGVQFEYLIGGYNQTFAISLEAFEDHFRLELAGLQGWPTGRRLLCPLRVHFTQHVPSQDVVPQLRRLCLQALQLICRQVIELELAVKIPLPERQLWPRQASDQRRRRADSNVFVPTILHANPTLVAKAAEFNGILPT